MAQRSKRITLSTAIAAICSLLLLGCGARPEWKEQVALKDGRVIVVERSDHLTRSLEMGGSGGWVFNSSTIEFLPSTQSVKKILWKGSAYPIAIDIHEGRSFLLTIIISYAGVKEFGRPKPGYVAFELKNDKWERIQIKDLPPGIKGNLLIFPSEQLIRLKQVTLNQKTLAMSSSNAGNEFKQIDPGHILTW